MELSEFEGSKHTSEFIKRIDTAFDLLNSRNPFAKGNKAPVTSKSLEAWSTKCRELANYMFGLKDEKGNLLRNGRRKTVIWGFSFSLHSVASICKELLTRKYLPYRFVLTYKFSQDHIELLFNKIRRHCGWNNNPNVMEFKYALRRIILRNSIEPSKTGNCTSFEDSLCKPSGLIDFSSKQRSTSSAEDYFFADDWDVVQEQRRLNPMEENDVMEDDHLTNTESLMRYLDSELRNELTDNVLYYIAGFVVKSLLQKLECGNCKAELLLNESDARDVQIANYPVFAKLTFFKQKKALTFPSVAVLKIVKATESIFRQRVIEEQKGINYEKKLDLKIQSAVLDLLGPHVFRDSSEHYFQHSIGAESDHLSSLVRLTVKKYLSLRLKSYGKRFTEMVIHGNVPSVRHTLTKAIIFKNQ